MRWFRKDKQEPEIEPLQAQTVIPRHIVPEDIMNEIRQLPREEEHKTKEIILNFLKTLNRPELMAFEDADQFKGFSERINGWVWEAYYDEEWQRKWPWGQHLYEQIIPDVVKSTISDYDELKKQVQGIQKKLDRLASILENTEITMSGKTALKL